MKKKKLKKLLTAVVTGSMMATSIVPVSAAEKLSPQYTYSGGGVTFEKISHADTATGKAEGVVDYVGNGEIAPYVAGESENGKGDRGQSYSYASASYGDWVYINTMYGGLGAAAILKRGMEGMSPEAATAMVNTMYNGQLYINEPDGKNAGGMLFKFNVKTGETKILMSKSTNGIIPTFRSAIKMNGKLYFVGMVMDINNPSLDATTINTAIAYQNGFPCIYEVDPANDDKLTCIYDCVDINGFRQLVNDKVFTSTRAISTYGDSMIAGCLDTNGVFLCASTDPSAGQDSFKRILEMSDMRVLGIEPAYHRSDVNGGGGIYQVVEYNGALYVVICTGTDATKNEYGTLQTFAILKGTCNGNVTDKSAWNWSVLAGNGGRYPYGLDEERVSAGACTLQVYGDYLYIGDYNDVSSALQGFITGKDFTTQATNLDQSINLYRMDKTEKIEKVVGDPTTAFPTSLTGLGSGYTVTDDSAGKMGTHMNQYTWQTTVYNGKLYVGTMDTTTLLEPITKFTNGDILKMTKEEWESQLNYLRVLIELLVKENQNAEIAEPAAESEEQETEAGDVAVNSVASENAVAEGTLDEATAKEMVQSAITAAQERADASSTANYISDQNAVAVDKITLSSEQTKELVNGLLNGSIRSGMIADDLMTELTQINNTMAAMSTLIDTTEIEEFANAYTALDEALDAILDKLPENVKALYKMLISYATKENLVGLASSLKYFVSSEAGFDLFEITDKGAAGASVAKVTTNGFGDRYTHGLRIFEKTSDYWVIGTANPFNGTQLWRTTNLDPDPVDPIPDPDPTPTPDPDPTPTPDPDPTPDPTPTPEPGKGSGVTADSGTKGGQYRKTKKTDVKTDKTDKNKKASVKTGDTADMILPAVVMLLSLAVILGAVMRFRKRQ